MPPEESEVAGLRKALVLSLADYAAKCGFFEAVLGLSGGIDSAITAALAAEALGSQKVLGVAMPGPYSSKGSLRDARELAKRLGIRFAEIPIGPVFEAYRRALSPAVPALLPARCCPVEAKRVGKSADAAGTSARATVGFTTYLQRWRESAQRRL